MLHFDPPTPLGKGGARKAFVANIKEIDIKTSQLHGSSKEQANSRENSL
jgi:hypothetical protein